MKKTKYRNNDDLISEMKQILRKPKLTLENMVFDNDEDYFYDNDKNLDKNEENEKIENNSEIPNEVDVTETINKIRQLSLNAIAKLANNPNSEQYQLLKKIWNMVDKCFETKNADKAHENI